MTEQASLKGFEAFMAERDRVPEAHSQAVCAWVRCYSLWFVSRFRRLPRSSRIRVSDGMSSRVMPVAKRMPKPSEMAMGMRNLA